MRLVKNTNEPLYEANHLDQKRVITHRQGSLTHMLVQSSQPVAYSTPRRLEKDIAP